MNNPYLFIALDLAPKAAARLIRSLPTSDYDRQIDDSRFTVREAVAHLADWEPIFLARIQAAVMSPGSSIAGMDESERARDQGYDNWAVGDSLRMWEERRGETIQYLRELLPEDWLKVVLHSEKGPLTVEDQASMLACHDTYHLEHLIQYLP